MLEDALQSFHTSSAERAAMKRLRSINQAKSGPDMIIKAFNDLDLVLFKGNLKDRVCVRWKNLKDTRFWGSLAYTKPVTDTPRSLTALRMYRMNRMTSVTITLNPDTFFDGLCEAPCRRMYGTLMHEMCVSLTLIGSCLFELY